MKIIFLVTEGYWDGGVVDEVPAPKVIERKEVESCFDWIVEQLEQFYNPDVPFDDLEGVFPLVDNPKVRDRFRELMLMLQEGEDNLFTKIDDVRDEVKEMLRDEFNEKGSLELLTLLGSQEGLFFGIYRMKV